MNIIILNRLQILCLAIGLLIIPAGLIGTNLHLILVGDYDSIELMPALRYDIKRLRQEASAIGKYTGLKIKETVLTGSMARTSNVMKAFDRLQPQDNDVILFYFTGHGFRTYSKEEPWPNLFFAFEDKAIDVGDIIESLNGKKGRLKMVMVDCCNNVIDDSMIPLVRKPARAARQDDKLIRKNYRELFLNFSGTIVMAGCLPEETSLALLGTGSLYTQAFFQILKKAINSKGTVDWQTILDDTSSKSMTWALKYDHDQHPFFLIKE